MHKDKLLKLAEFLETRVPKKAFNLAIWTTGGYEEPTPECGSTACALGWAAKARLFGLGLIGDTPMYGTKMGFDAAKEVFNITFREAAFLFSPGTSPSGERDVCAVAKRIRQFANSNWFQRKVMVRKAYDAI